MVVARVFADAVLEKFGADTVREIERNMEAYLKQNVGMQA
jgi:hypothetical protein